MKNILFLTLISLLGFEAAAQKSCVLTLSGKVVDESGNALPGATVFIKEKNVGAVADVNGNFRMEDLCAGRLNVEIKYLGYKTEASPINLTSSITLNFSLKQDENVLNEVIVHEQLENLETTKNYSTISGKQLEEAQGKTLGEVLKEMTGVSSIQTGPAIFKPVIHGVHSQRVLILNNGIRQEGQQWGAEHAPEIDPFIATNIVIIKDAGAIKYGTDALGGVVIVNPAELPTTAGLGGELHLLGSTNGRSGTVSGTLEGGLKKLEGWGWRGQGTGKRSGDFHAADYNLTNTGFKEANFSASTGFHKENKGLEFFYSHFTTTIGILRGSAVSSTGDLATAMEREPPQYTEPFSYKIQQPRQEVSHDLLKINGHVTKGDNLYRFQYGFQYNKREEFDFRKGSLKEIPALGYKLFTQTLDLEMERVQNKYFNGSIGLNAMMQDNNKIDGTQTIPFIPNFTNISGGLFIIEKYKRNKWELEAGLRYDYRYYHVVGFDFRNEIYKANLEFNNASGTLGGKYLINEVSSFTSNLGSTWRPPNVAELYSLGTHQSAAAIEYGLLLDEETAEVKDISSINFKTEQALKWVNTYNYTKGPLSLEVAGYVNYIFNYIYLKPKGVTQNIRGIFPYFHYTQTDASFIGSDISIHYSGIKRWSLSTKASLLRAKDETNNDYLIWIPSNRFDFTARYTVPGTSNWKNFFAEMRLKYVAHQGRAPRVVTVREINEANAQGIDLFANDSSNFDFMAAPPGYFLAGLSTGVSFKLKESQMDIRLSADNLFNQAYREYTNRMRYYADDLGNNFTLALKYSF
ncbi:MAG TPA: TonB-dependent receptor [Cyclobacteriaceae bacterium]